MLREADSSAIIYIQILSSRTVARSIAKLHYTDVNSVPLIARNGQPYTIDTSKPTVFDTMRQYMDLQPENLKDEKRNEE